jgi:CRP/FNR family transcriptional regulator, cyclic AMP receptor protein
MPETIAKACIASRTAKGELNIDVISFLKSTGIAQNLKVYKRKEIIYSQGDSAKPIVHLEEGGVKRSVISESGKEAVVAVVGEGDFFGEGCLVR